MKYLIEVNEMHSKMTAKSKNSTRITLIVNSLIKILNE